MDGAAAFEDAGGILGLLALEISNASNAIVPNYPFAS
jgi:hypothetical protein